MLLYFLYNPLIFSIYYFLLTLSYLAQLTFNFKRLLKSWTKTLFERIKKKRKINRRTRKFKLEKLLFFQVLTYIMEMFFFFYERIVPSFHTGKFEETLVTKIKSKFCSKRSKFRISLQKVNVRLFGLLAKTYFHGRLVTRWQLSINIPSLLKLCSALSNNFPIWKPVVFQTFLIFMHKTIAKIFKIFGFFNAHAKKKYSAAKLNF